LSANTPSGASVTSSETSRRVASPITTSPSRACSCRARRDVHRIADDLGVASLDDDLAGVDGDAQPDRRRPPRLLARARGTRAASPTAARTARIASSSATRGDAEDRHHAVAEQLVTTCRRAPRPRRASPRSSAP
jgi:hypothetical protein